jgi:hypothetical protein
LIDELKQLWSFRALTYDVSWKQDFIMEAILIWTINDFHVKDWFLVEAHIEN